MSSDHPVKSASFEMSSTNSPCPHDSRIRKPRQHVFHLWTALLALELPGPLAALVYLAPQVQLRALTFLDGGFPAIVSLTIADFGGGRVLAGSLLEASSRLWASNADLVGKGRPYN